MKKYASALSILLLLSFWMIDTQAGSPHKFVGVKKCKTCHNTKKIGKQYEVWSKGPHANAYKSLSGAKALEYARKNGIENPAKEPACLKCHATAAAVMPDQIDKQGKLELEEGVSCESCHGAGSDFKKNNIMKDIELAKKNGLMMPTARDCQKCHNDQNPFHKPFDFKQAAAKISHPIPGR